MVRSSRWRTALGSLKSFRKQLAIESFLNYNVEFHCAEMIDPHKIKEFTSISVPDRWKLIERYAETIGENSAF